MGKQRTKKKHAFLTHYKQHGSVTRAAEAAGYAQPGPCYRYLKTGDDGEYLDPIVRSMLGTPEPEEPEQVTLPSNVLKLVPKADREVTPTIEGVQALLWSIANDQLTAAGPRVQAASILLKDLRETVEEEYESPEDIVEDIRRALYVPR
ncbi:hypothetical protein FRD01_02575 [Microvenator marinus]|uniref:Terminase small subunit n=1 Tax=Microvenator marinus TaxID=2600177 RepID=A0A5B8XLZ2_9DELT|nr:hypothetical protein [Microvenator marinus]QED26161.1 hypothetical protein FRD01_02575 [Microvenator marinus]